MGRKAARAKANLQLRGIPADLRDRIRRRAERKGLSMTQYVTDLIEDDLSRPTWEELLEELHRLPPVKLPHPAAYYLHEARREEGVED